MFVLAILGGAGLVDVGRSPERSAFQKSQKPSVLPIVLMPVSIVDEVSID